MTAAESFLYAMFCMAIVFGVLISLFLIIKLSSLICLFTRGNKKGAYTTLESKPVSKTVNIAETSGGELTLYNVDEPTAAMIMAIVCDQTDIPLNELRFISIKAKN